MGEVMTECRSRCVSRKLRRTHLFSRNGKDFLALEPPSWVPLHALVTCGLALIPWTNVHFASCDPTRDTRPDTPTEAFAEEAMHGTLASTGRTIPPVKKRSILGDREDYSERTRTNSSSLRQEKQRPQLVPTPGLRTPPVAPDVEDIYKTPPYTNARPIGEPLQLLPQSLLQPVSKNAEQPEQVDADGALKRRRTLKNDAARDVRKKTVLTIGTKSENTDEGSSGLAFSEESRPSSHVQSDKVRSLSSQSDSSTHAFGNEHLFPSFARSSWLGDPGAVRLLVGQLQSPHTEEGLQNMLLRLGIFLALLNECLRSKPELGVKLLKRAARLRKLVTKGALTSERASVELFSSSAFQELVRCAQSKIISAVEARRAQKEIDSLREYGLLPPDTFT